MKKIRIIPIVLFRNGHVVQSRKFSEYKNLGNPLLTINRLSEWGADEVCFLDISGNDKLIKSRSDLNEKTPQTFLEVLAEVSKVAYMPLTCGGGITSLEEIKTRIKLGADKVSVNWMLFYNPLEVVKAVNLFGSQCIVASIDVKIEEGRYVAFVSGGKVSTGFEMQDWIRKVEMLGVGEILLNSIDKDGQKNGYDIQMINLACKTTNIPIIACGGVGDWEHFAEAIKYTKTDAVSAANYFQHKELSVYNTHNELLKNGFNVRSPRLLETDYFKELR